MNQVMLVGQVEGPYEIIYDKRENNRKLIKFMIRVQRPYKNKEGAFDTDLVNVKVWTNNIEDIEGTLSEKSFIAVKGRIQSYKINNYEEDSYFNDIIADRINNLFK